MTEQVTGSVLQVVNTNSHQYFIVQFSDENGVVRDCLGLAKDLKIIRNHFCMLQVGDEVQFTPEWSPRHGRYNAKKASVDIAIENMPERETSQMAFVSIFEGKNRYFCRRQCGCRLLVRFNPGSPRVKIGDWIRHSVQEDVLGRFFATNVQLTAAPDCAAEQTGDSGNAS